MLKLKLNKISKCVDNFFLLTIFLIFIYKIFHYYLKNIQKFV
jgi:hypothetical protein